MHRARRDEAAAAACGGVGREGHQRRMFLTLYQPFLQESPTILNPFLNRTLSSFALSFTCCSKPAIARAFLPAESTRKTLETTETAREQHRRVGFQHESVGLLWLYRGGPALFLRTNRAAGRAEASSTCVAPRWIPYPPRPPLSFPYFRRAIPRLPHRAVQLRGTRGGHRVGTR
ncbi:hypothetical protein NL676_017472 [Syzygium grande]|nr:hypothetical protein NL676_017472 [Syzygium grande]